MDRSEFFSVLAAVGEHNIAATLILIAVLTLLRHVAVHHLNANKSLQSDDKRRLIVVMRNVLLVLFLFGLVLIWANELRTLALSVVAFVAAIVIATKELILCLSGNVVRSASHSFRLGDRVEINNLRGDVIDMGVLYTTILEIGPGQASHQHTGRAITVPNALFVSASVINESFTDEYVLHSFSVPLKADDDWEKAETLLLAAAREEFSTYEELARNNMVKFQRRHGMESPNMEPRVSIQIPDPGRINLLVRLAMPARRKGRIEQAIMRRFLREWRKPDAEAPVPDHSI